MEVAAHPEVLNTLIRAAEPLAVLAQTLLPALRPLLHTYVLLLLLVQTAGTRGLRLPHVCVTAVMSSPGQTQKKSQIEGKDALPAASSHKERIRGVADILYSKSGTWGKEFWSV
jgi:hypothetical protein